MEPPPAESPPSDPTPKISPQLQIGLTLLIAAVIVGILALAYRATAGKPAPTPTAVAAVTEPWPTVPPTFTPTPTATAIVPSPTATSTPTPTPTPTLTPTPTATPIVIGWKELGYLTTVQYTLQTAVAVERERPWPLPPERVVMLAVGNVQAGIDMTKIDEEDVEIRGRRVKVTLPPPEVTSVEILPDETQIFDTEKGFFFSDYEGLETEALGKARRELEGWAVNRMEILEKAQKFARLQLTDFLHKLGFEEVEITFENPRSR